jgi:hypothetical protein
VAGTCEYGKEPSSSIKMRGLSWLATKTGQLLKKNSAPCSNVQVIRKGSLDWGKVRKDAYSMIRNVVTGCKVM